MEKTYPECGHHHPMGWDPGAQEHPPTSLHFLGIEAMGPTTSHSLQPHLQHNDGLYPRNPYADIVEHYVIEKSN